VQPYSIKNLTSYPIKVLKSKKLPLVEPIDEALLAMEGAHQSVLNSFYDSIV
jgi:hypothetical protein